MQVNALCIGTLELPVALAHCTAPSGQQWRWAKGVSPGKALRVRRTWCPEASLELVAVLAAVLVGQALCHFLQQRVVLPVSGNRVCFKMMALFSLLTSRLCGVVKYLWQVDICIFTALRKISFL